MRRGSIGRVDRIGIVTKVFGMAKKLRLIQTPGLFRATIESFELKKLPAGEAFHVRFKIAESSVESVEVGSTYDWVQKTKYPHLTTMLVDAMAVSQDRGCETLVLETVRADVGTGDLLIHYWRPDWKRG